MAVRGYTPSLDNIASYWEQHFSDVFPNLEATRIGWREPFCFRCSWLVPAPDPYASRKWNTARGWLERAHLLDFSSGGSNLAHNLVPLCLFCHKIMPPFDDYIKALKWVRDGPSVEDHYWQIYTDTHWGDENYPKDIPSWHALWSRRQKLNERLRGIT